jgi:hypothetical protein
MELNFIATTTLVLFASSAINTSLEKSNLDGQTKASESIFLEPGSPARRIIFVSVCNTPDKDLNFRPPIVERLENSGYRITDDPEAAQFMLQANVRKVAKDNLESVDRYTDAGFGGAMPGSAVASQSDNTQGSGTTVTQSLDYSTVDWKTYHARIVSSANQANLRFEDALPALENGLIRSIAGLFAE